MTLVEMLESKMGSENGYAVKHYIKGKRYRIGDFLLEAFILDGVVRIIDEQHDGFYDPISMNENTNETYDNKPIKRGRGRPPSS